jgi:two-component system response regulator FixJ
MTTTLIGRQISVIGDGNGRNAIPTLLDDAGFMVRAYASAAHFLSDPMPGGGCLVANVFMPDMDGLELLREIAHRGIAIPTVLISSHADVTLAVAAMKAGAVDFLLKPLDAEKLVASVEHALRIGWKTSKRAAERRAAYETLALLTPRERHVLEQLVEGHSNKAAAHELGISTRTVEFHRAHIMEKLNARNMSDVVRLALMLEGSADKSVGAVERSGRAAPSPVHAARRWARR